MSPVTVGEGNGVRTLDAEKSRVHQIRIQSCCIDERTEQLNSGESIRSDLHAYVEQFRKFMHKLGGFVEIDRCIQTYTAKQS